MTVLPIRISGDPVLHNPAQKVDGVDASLQQLVVDMFETMDAAPGVGLAAPQVGLPYRLFVFGYTDHDGTQWRDVAINPTLWISPPPPSDPDKDHDAEGCLSFPGERFPLLRADSALLCATNIEGEDYEIQADGWLARIFQHEYDHLNGILYTDRLIRPYAKAAAKIFLKNYAGVSGQSWLPGVDQFEE
jgi:peptide deformylase